MQSQKKKVCHMIYGLPTVMVLLVASYKISRLVPSSLSAPPPSPALANCNPRHLPISLHHHLF
jgi:hypothetical protein